MMYEENCDCGEEHEGMHHHMMKGPMMKEFKLAMLEKKEKMMRAKLEFIEKMKEMIKKMPDEKE